MMNGDINPQPKKQRHYPKGSPYDITKCRAFPHKECCTHFASQPFQMSISTGGSFVGYNNTCCWCGPIRIEYVNIYDEGHGPWISFKRPKQHNLVIAKDVRGL